MGIGGDGKSILPEMKEYMIINNVSLKEIGISIRNLTIGIDATSWLVDGKGRGQPDYIEDKCEELKKLNITPFLVFDTMAPPVKQRNHPNYVSGLVRKVLQEKKIKYICAPYEADAQLSYMMKKKYISAVLTKDTDLIAHGVSKIIYELPHGAGYSLYEFEHLTEKHKLWSDFTRNMLLETCIFTGCDYNTQYGSRCFYIGEADKSSPTLIDLKCAVELIRRHGNYKSVIQNEDIWLYIEDDVFVNGKTHILHIFELCLAAFTCQQVWDPETETSHRSSSEYTIDQDSVKEACGLLLEDIHLKKLQGLQRPNDLFLNSGVVGPPVGHLKLNGKKRKEISTIVPAVRKKLAAPPTSLKENVIQLIQRIMKSNIPTDIGAAAVALDAIATNDKIYNIMIENGGIDAVMMIIKEINLYATAIESDWETVQACCSLLSKLAESQPQVIDKNCFNDLCQLAAKGSDDSTVMAKILSTLRTLSNSLNFASLNLEGSNIGSILGQVMRKFPNEQKIQQLCCYITGNICETNTHIKNIMLEDDVENMIRVVKNQSNCLEAANYALRMLNLAD